VVDIKVFKPIITYWPVGQVAFICYTSSLKITMNSPPFVLNSDKLCEMLCKFICRLAMLLKQKTLQTNKL